MNRITVYRTILFASLFALCFATAVRSVRAAANRDVSDFTITGTVSCARCQGIQPMHKGYTPYSWALFSVSQGDDIVLVAQGTAYKLQGDKRQLLQYMGEKARITGRRDGNTLEVEAITRPAKNE
jgi:hypothetical protein